MFTEKQLERYADVLWWGLTTAKKVTFKKNDIILIRYNSSAVRLAEVLYAGLLSRGMQPVQRMSPTATMERDFYLRASSRQLVFLPPVSYTHLRAHETVVRISYAVLCL